MTLVADPSISDLFRHAMTQQRRPTARVVFDHAKYRGDPVGWMRDAMGIDEATLRWSLFGGYDRHTWDGDTDPLARVLEALAEGRWVAVSSGTGTGKTYVAALAKLWFIATREGGICVTIATKQDQSLKGVWRYVGELWPRFAAHFPEAELTTGRIRMRVGSDAWGAWIITADPSATDRTGTEQSNASVQGLHAKDLLILVDEAPGVDPSVITALINTSTGEGNLIAAFGNPDYRDDPLGRFARWPGVVALRVSALDHPNVVTGVEHVPGAATRKSVQMRAQQYGTTSPLYESRVQGKAPEQSSFALIQRTWLDAAVARGANIESGLAMRTGAKALGVDVAQSERGDLAAIAAGIGQTLLEVRAFPCPNATTLGRDVWAAMRRDGVAPEHVGVDPIGVGAATVNALDELTDSAQLARVHRLGGAQKPMVGINRADGTTPEHWTSDANRFLNLRAQMWWQLREDLDAGRIAFAQADEELFRELTSVQFDEHGKTVQIEAKDAMRKRLGRSPDRADAVVMWNWIRPRALTPPRVPVGQDIARARTQYGTRRDTAPAPLTTPRHTAWRPT